MWFIGKHRPPCIIDARRNRQLGGKGSHGRCGGSALENVHALTWPTFATRRNWQLVVIGVFGSLGGKEVMEDAVAQLSKTSGPDLANIGGIGAEEVMEEAYASLHVRAVRQTESPVGERGL